LQFCVDAHTLRPWGEIVKKKEKPELVALTVKVPVDVFVRLSTLRAIERKTVQEMLTEAIAAYMKKAGA